MDDSELEASALHKERMAYRSAHSALQHATGYESTMPSRGKPYSKLVLHFAPTNDGHRHAMTLLSVVMAAMREREKP